MVKRGLDAPIATAGSIERTGDLGDLMDGLTEPRPTIESRESVAGTERDELTLALAVAADRTKSATGRGAWRTNQRAISGGEWLAALSVSAV